MQFDIFFTLDNVRVTLVRLYLLISRKYIYFRDIVYNKKNTEGKDDEEKSVAWFIELKFKC